jgi:hygromycin-B 7''-O-kinase
MYMLPGDFSTEFYWSEIYTKPLDYWQPVLQQISNRAHLGDSWQRARLGRNIVFLNQKFALKLNPPCWQGEIARETTAAALVAGKLPVDTPQCVAQGCVDSWEYLVQSRLSGRNLHEIWTGLTVQQRANLAVQHGEILAALHGFSSNDLSSSSLVFDWTDMYARQREVCQVEMAASALHPALVEDAERYLDLTAPLLSPAGDTVLLHGDLTHLNLLVDEQPSGWQITGLIDWGDAKTGPRGHEFISPGVHMYLGERVVLDAFYQKALRRNPQELMARAMLYYTGEFDQILRRVPGGSDCRTWDAVEELMW